MFRITWMHDSAWKDLPCKCLALPHWKSLWLSISFHHKNSITFWLLNWYQSMTFRGTVYICWMTSGSACQRIYQDVTGLTVNILDLDQCCYHASDPLRVRSKLWYIQHVKAAACLRANIRVIASKQVSALLSTGAARDKNVAEGLYMIEWCWGGGDWC